MSTIERSQTEKPFQKSAWRKIAARAAGAGVGMVIVLGTLHGKNTMAQAPDPNHPLIEPTEPQITICEPEQNILIPFDEILPRECRFPPVDELVPPPTVDESPKLLTK